MEFIPDPEQKIKEQSNPMYKLEVREKRQENYELKNSIQWQDEFTITKIIGDIEQEIQSNAYCNQKNIQIVIYGKEKQYQILKILQLYFYLFNKMNKSQHSSTHKVLGPPQIIMFDGEESRFQKRIFREHSTDKIKFCWEQSPIHKKNDFNFQKINYVNQQDMDVHVRNSYQLPQIYKRKNQLNNECFVLSPQLTVEQEQKFGKYAKRYTQDSDIFSLKVPIEKQYSQHSSAYGQFYFQPEFKLTKTKPVFKYHTAKSQILGNSRLQYIKLRQEMD
ncbi:unnamed protein product [Paramecium primaurelia]|uniref:Uncharacterized protein n=1 Tax=Paramecium primaurelia TaxID=5886 RepID=A0A8S1PDS8_PARPR|nr:unnamed protein product [Paramecium primaurelia]